MSQTLLSLVSLSVAQVVPRDVRVPAFPTLLQLRNLFDGIPICRARRIHCGLHSRALTSHHGSDGRVEDSGPRRCGGAKRGGGASQGLWPSRCRSRLAGDNRHTVPDRLDHEVVHRHGLGAFDGRAAHGGKKPVREYIPEFRLHDAVATDRITVRDLLCHHSGLPRHDWIWVPGDLSPAQMLAAMRYLEPSDDIRSTFQYLNLGDLVASIGPNASAVRVGPNLPVLD